MNKKTYGVTTKRFNGVKENKSNTPKNDKINKSASECFKDFNDAVVNLMNEIAKELYLYKFMDWLENKLTKLRKIK